MDLEDIFSIEPSAKRNRPTKTRRNSGPAESANGEGARQDQAVHTFSTGNQQGNSSRPPSGQIRKLKAPSSIQRPKNATATRQRANAGHVQSSPYHSVAPSTFGDQQSHATPWPQRFAAFSALGPKECNSAVKLHLRQFISNRMLTGDKQFHSSGQAPLANSFAPQMGTPNNPKAMNMFPPNVFPFTPITPGSKLNQGSHKAPGISIAKTKEEPKPILKHSCSFEAFQNWINFDGLEDGSSAQAVVSPYHHVYSERTEPSDESKFKFPFLESKLEMLDANATQISGSLASQVDFDLDTKASVNTNNLMLTNDALQTSLLFDEEFSRYYDPSATFSNSFYSTLQPCDFSLMGSFSDQKSANSFLHSLDFIAE